MTQLDNQTIFNKALFGIRGQGYRPSRSPSSRFGGCNYRTHLEYGGTLACAVGHCIPDDVAEHWDDVNHGDTSIGWIAEALPEEFNQFFHEDSLPLLKVLQQVHDDPGFTSEWFEVRMRDIANEYSLVYTPCNV